MAPENNMPEEQCSPEGRSLHAVPGGEGSSAVYACHPPGGLPFALTSFVGREREVAEAGRLLSENRLVTLSRITQITYFWGNLRIVGSAFRDPLFAVLRLAVFRGGFQVP